MSSVYFSPGLDSSVNGWGFYLFISLSISNKYIYLCVFVRNLCLLRNMTKMENAKVEIDDGKEESALPDTLY